MTWSERDVVLSRPSELRLDVYSRCMRRTQIYLTDEQSAKIAQLAGDRHASKAEIIRRILDEALGIGDEDDDGARSAIEATAGLCRDYPEWPEWLEAVRGRTADDRLSSLGL